VRLDRDMHETAIREPKPETPLPWMGELHDPVSQAEVSLFIGGNRAFWAGREIFKTILGGNDAGWRDAVGSFGVTRDFVAVLGSKGEGGCVDR
jgi:hypothetical protein